ncbi:MAG TPA: chromate transporter [Candidatus Tetragenococcus pullicola]|nr:chromate transporter [Candidatus Tetragenococcus pullicola]
MFRSFFISGLLTFSGGVAMVPLLHEELVEKNNLLNSKDFYKFVGLSQTLPGTVGLLLACFVGKKVNGKKGMATAGLATILPAFVLMLLLSVFYQYIPDTPIVNGALTAIRATAPIFVLEAALNMSGVALDKISWKVGIVGLALLIFIFNIPILAVIGATFVVSVLQSVLSYVKERRPKK